LGENKFAQGQKEGPIRILPRFLNCCKIFDAVLMQRNLSSSKGELDDPIWNYWGKIIGALTMGE